MFMFRKLTCVPSPHVLCRNHAYFFSALSKAPPSGQNGSPLETLLSRSYSASSSASPRLRVQSPVTKCQNNFEPTQPHQNKAPPSENPLPGYPHGALLACYSLRVVKACAPLRRPQRISSWPGSVATWVVWVRTLFKKTRESRWTGREFSLRGILCPEAGCS